MIKPEFREDVLEAVATLDGLSRAPSVGVDDLDAVAGPAQRHGHVGQGILGPIPKSEPLLIVKAEPPEVFP
jgi:hypothetical protein